MSINISPVRSVSFSQNKINDEKSTPKTSIVTKSLIGGLGGAALGMSSMCLNEAKKYPYPSVTKIIAKNTVLGMLLFGVGDYVWANVSQALDNENQFDYYY